MNDALRSFFSAPATTEGLLGVMITALTTLLVCAVYGLALKTYRRAKHFPLAHPLALGSIALAFLVAILYGDYSHFRDHSQVFYWFLGPTTVALALPLHREFSRIRAVAKPVSLGLLAGALISPAVALALAWALGGDKVLLSLATKSVTTPIALELSEKIGSIAALAAGVVIFTGVVGALTAAPLLRLAGIKDERVLGLVLGINAHGVGTATAFQVSPRCGAFASLAMGITGIVTALILPLLVRLFA
ncbi:MAG: LrgB family protein [Porticoccaceae bacterium]|nr:LrgB family protein [Porticoccaceae bacterium]